MGSRVELFAAVRRGARVEELSIPELARRHSVHRRTVRQASDDSVDVVDCECDMTDARGVRRRVPVAAPARRGVTLRLLEPSVAVRGLHHRDLCPDALEPHHAGRSATQLAAEIIRLTGWCTV
jgi:hypothetical protein